MARRQRGRLHYRARVSNSPDPAAFLAGLAERLSPEHLVTRAETLEGLRRDQTPIIEAGTPIAAVFPTSTDEVATVLQLASKHRVPVVPRGAGSGLAGGANAVDGGIVLSLMRMDQILEIDTVGEAHRFLNRAVLLRVQSPSWLKVVIWAAPAVLPSLKRDG